MIQVELNNVYINIGANNGGGNLGTKKKTLRLPISWLKQHMIRTFMFIYFL